MNSQKLQQKRGVKKICIIQNFLKKKALSSKKYGVGDPGSEIRDPEKTYSGSCPRGQKRTGSWIPDPDPLHW